jgi:hypothetical protein
MAGITDYVDKKVLGWAILGGIGFFAVRHLMKQAEDKVDNFKDSLGIGTTKEEREQEVAQKKAVAVAQNSHLKWIDAQINYYSVKFPKLKRTNASTWYALSANEIAREFNEKGFFSTGTLFGNIIGEDKKRIESIFEKVRNNVDMMYLEKAYGVRYGKTLRDTMLMLPKTGIFFLNLETINSFLRKNVNQIFRFND